MLSCPGLCALMLLIILEYGLSRDLYGNLTFNQKLRDWLINGQDFYVLCQS